MRLQAPLDQRKVKIDGIFDIFNAFNGANYDPTTFQLNEHNPKYGQPNREHNHPYSPGMLPLGFRPFASVAPSQAASENYRVHRIFGPAIPEYCRRLVIGRVGRIQSFRRLE